MGLNSAGILIEILGAGLLLHYAYSARSRMKSQKTDLDNIQAAVDNLLDEVGSQFKKQAVGFVLLGLGLILQLASGIGN